MSSFIQKINKNKEVIIRGTGLLLVDVCLIALCMIGALWIRFDFDYKKIEPLFLHSIEKYMWINIVCTVIINYIFKLYASLWRFASVEELKNVVCAVLISSFLQLCCISIF